MGKKQQPVEDGPQGAPEWVVTFTDMISLLVTFFVLLMTYSSLDPMRVVKVSSLLDSEAGVLQDQAGDFVPNLTEDELASNVDLERGALHAHSRPPEELAENLEEMGQKKTDEHKELDLSEVADGIVILFGPDCSFEPGSARPNAVLRDRLKELGEVLEHYGHLVVLEGHTDDRFLATDEYPDAHAMGAARATAAAQTLLSKTKLSPKLVQVASAGAAKPAADNATALGRQRNRRVIARILTLSKSRALSLELTREQQRREAGE